MPPKKTAAAKPKKTKAPRLSDEDEDNVEFLDVQYNPDLVHSLLEDLKIQIDTKCNQIQKDSDFMVTSIQQAFHLEIIKLPTQVKKMSLAKFKSEFGANLEAVTKGAMKPKPAPAVNSNNSIYQSAVKSKYNQNNSHNNSVFQTPLTSRSQMVAETPMSRNPREGELICSANGSPLGQFGTVVKPKNTASLMIPQTPGVYVPLDNGDIVDLENIDVTSLSQEMKQDALSKMQSMLNNMQMIMQKLSAAQ